MKHKDRLPPFVPLLTATMDAPAWRALSHGAARLYVSLKRRANGGHKSYISYRDAVRELKAGRGKIREWFAELEHYGFTELATHGSLGVDGKGRAPQWRLTEKGCTSKTSPNGLFEPPPNNFLRWDGTPFEVKPYRLAHRGTKRAAPSWEKQNPSTHGGNSSVPTADTPPVPTAVPPPTQIGTHGGAIEGNQIGTHGGAISRFTTTSGHALSAIEGREASAAQIERRKQ